MLVGEGLGELSDNTRLKSGDAVRFLTSQSDQNLATSTSLLLHLSDSSLAVTKLGFRASAAAGEQVLRGLYLFS